MYFLKKKKGGGGEEKVCLRTVSFETVCPALRNILFIIWMFIISFILRPVRQG